MYIVWLGKNQHDFVGLFCFPMSYCNFHIEIEMPLGPKLLSEYIAAWNTNVSSSVILPTVVPQLLTVYISIATLFCITSFNIVLNQILTTL